MHDITTQDIIVVGAVLITSYFLGRHLRDPEKKNEQNNEDDQNE